MPEWYPRIIPLKCQADHISLLLKLLQWFSTAFTIKFQFLPATQVSWWSGPCYFCSLRPCLCPGVNWDSLQSITSALPASATGLLLPGVLLSFKTVELLDTCHSEVTFSAKQQQLNSLPLICPLHAFKPLLELITLYDNHSVTCLYPLLHWNYLKCCTMAYEIYMLSRLCCFGETLKSMYCMRFGCIYLRVKWVLGT